MNLSLWTLNHNVLQANVEGIFETRDVEFVNIIDDEKVIVASSGKKPDKNYIQREFHMSYQLNDNTIDIGKLTVIISLNGVYQRLLDTVLVVLISNAVKTFLVAIFIYYLFQHLVGRHISKVAEYSEGLGLETIDSILEYDRKENAFNNLDEFDSLRNSLLKMQRKVKEATNLMVQRENDLAITLNSIGDAVIATNKRGEVTRMNPVAEVLTGWSFTQAKGKLVKDIFSVINTNTREPINNPIKKVIDHGKTVHLSEHTTLISKNGVESQITSSVAPIRGHHDTLGMVLVFNDVSEQYQLREAATKYKKDLEAIMDNSPALIYVKDTDGRYLLINQYYEESFHIQRKDVIGKTDYDIFPEKFAKKFQGNDEKVMATGKASEYEEITPHDNINHTYHSIKFPLYDSTNNIYAVCSISTDITEKKTKDLQIRRSQKMDALGKLTGGIAHDYNNMLGIILGYSELLKDKLNDQPRLAKYAEHIQHASKRGAKLTSKLLSFSRMDTSSATKVNINTLLHEEQDMLQKTLTVRINLILELDKELWPSWLDSSELEDTVLNMCINALHAMEDLTTGARLTIHTNNQTISPFDADILNIKPGDYVQLSFTDTGRGMDNSTKEKIFEPFFSTKGDKGTGLGLSQVFGFVKRSMGAISVYSEPGHGSEFTLYFPRHLNENDKKLIEDISNDGIVAGTEKILIVDDEESLGELCSTILSQQGYHTLYAASGMHALHILEHESVNMIISDVIMPDMDGYQLASIVQEKYPAVKIQMVSGFSDNRKHKTNDKSLQKNLLTKPYSAINLLKQVRTLLDSN